MNKKGNTYTYNIYILIIHIACILLCSCSGAQSDTKLSGEDIKNIKENIIYASLQAELFDLIDLSVKAQQDQDNNYIEDGPGQNPTDDRFACATITIKRSQNSTPDNPMGDIIVSFADNCQDLLNNYKKGAIHINFKNKYTSLDSKLVCKMQSFYSNGILIEGEYTIAKAGRNISLKNGKLTYPNGSYITQEALLVRQWNSNKNNPSKDYWSITGRALGKMYQDQIIYRCVILSDLIYPMNCARKQTVFLPVSGSLSFDFVSGTEDHHYIYDYGQGECDNKLTIQMEDRTKELILDN